jgi:hypothetical protein
LLLKTNLRLLLGQLEALAETPYFSPRLDTYIEQLCEVSRELLRKLDSPSPTINLDVARFIGDGLWSLTQFLTGSTSKRIPYEVAFSVERAVQSWTKLDLLVTTAILHDGNFWFKSVQPAFFNAIEAELSIRISSRPVQIALPDLYRHKPLFCTPLFHELGHYVDIANEVVTTSMLLSPPDKGPDLPDLPPAAAFPAMSPEQRKRFESVTTSHRREYFADLFSTMYVGEAAKGFLQEFVPNGAVSFSHPSSAARYKAMDEFMSGTHSPIINLFQDALTARGLSKLTKRYALCDVKDSFSNFRPCTLHSDAELFGLFEAGWGFLAQQTASPAGQWAHLPEEERERVVNDLVEKSIRNHMVVEGWNAAAHQA